MLEERIASGAGGAACGAQDHSAAHERGRHDARERGQSPAGAPRILEVLRAKSLAISKSSILILRGMALVKLADSLFEFGSCFGLRNQLDMAQRVPRSGGELPPCAYMYVVGNTAHSIYPGHAH